MPVRIEIEGLEELRKRFERAPQAFDHGLRVTMWSVLDKLREKVPAYPPAKPESSYIRTGTLGRTLGSSETGGKAQGEPDIYTVEQSGRYMTGSFGTRLEYAPYVIGEKQAAQHQGRWWTLLSVAKSAVKDIERLFQVFTEEMAAWLNGTGREP